MAGKADFTEAEWDSLHLGLTGAGMLVAVSDAGFDEHVTPWRAAALVF
jgi:hypothetical protein